MYSDALKPYRKPGSIRNEIDNLLHGLFGGPIHTGPLAGEWLPPADLIETIDKIVITAELPGLNANDIELNINGNLLTIKGEKKRLKEEKEENHYFGDRFYGSFRRTFQLSADVDEDKAAAIFNKGVLKISLPKVATAKSKKIKINIH
jgi:HSP20 family protein